MTFKLGGKQIWLDWCEQLKKRADEVMQTLRNEGALSEACFLSEDGESVLYFMEVNDLDQAKAAFKASTLQIDSEHREAILQSLDRGEELTSLFHFENRHFQNRDSK